MRHYCIILGLLLLCTLTVNSQNTNNCTQVPACSQCNIDQSENDGIC